MKQDQTCELELNASDLYTLSQFCKTLKECGSMDWEHMEFRALLTLIPRSAESAQNLQAFLENEKALGIGGLPVLAKALL